MSRDAQALLRTVAPDPRAWCARSDAAYVYFRIQAYAVAHAWARCRRDHGRRAAEAFYQRPVQHALRVHALQLSLEALHGSEQGLANFHCDGDDVRAAPVYEAPSTFSREHPLHWELPCEVSSGQRLALAELVQSFRDGSWVRGNRRRNK